MASLLTRFVLRSETTEPSDQEFDLALSELARLLRSEMRRRGLFSAPPRYLGIVGQRFSDEDTFTDLLYDVYVFAILDRLAALRRRAKNQDIDGAVRLNVRLFLFERQKQQDPVGYRVFEIAREAAVRLIREGQLEAATDSDEEKITATTLLALPPFDTAVAHGPLDDELIGHWCETLMPDLVSAYHRQEVIERLASLIRTLPDNDVSAFLLRDLVNPLKSIARPRAVALFTEGAVHILDGDEATVDFPVLPSGEYEERQALQRLIGCIKGSIEGRRSVKERNYLHRLLDFLASWSAMMSEGSASDRPSDAQLSRQLDIPRGRIPRLLTTLSDMTSACRGARALSGASGAGRQPTTRKEDMSLHKRREALRRATAGGMDPQRDKQSATDEIAPADVVSWSAQPAEPTEWLVVSWSADGGLLVPVDDAPMRGSKDLDLSSVAGEPLFARCAQAARVSADTALDTVWRLPPTTAPRALETVNACLEALEDDSPPALEVDESPFYIEHVASIEAARTLLLKSTSTSTSTDTLPENVASFDAHRRQDPGAGSAPPAWGLWLAAIFALAAFGFGLKSSRLSKELESAHLQVQEAQRALSEIRFFPESETESFSLGRFRSGGTAKLIEPVGNRVLLDLTFIPPDEFSSYLFQCLDRSTGEVLFETEIENFSSTARLALAAVEKTVELRLLGVDDQGNHDVISSETVRIVPKGQEATP